MTTKTISTYYAAGYAPTAQYDALNITAAGVVGGYGLKLNFAVTVENHGRIDGLNAGVTAYADAIIKNASSGRIEGASGIIASNAAVTVANHGAVYGGGGEGDGISLLAGGAVINGGSHDTSALVEGERFGMESAAPARVANFGTIEGLKSNGVRLISGGMLTNGSPSDTGALVAGDDIAVFVQDAPATIANFGTLQAREGPGATVLLNAGGRVTNGSAADIRALIAGPVAGVAATTKSATVANFGAIEGTDAGVDLLAGGVVTNGSASDTSALIEGYLAVGGIDASATLTNFGTITGLDVYGAVDLREGGRVTNGSTADSGALIEGVVGVAGVSASTTVTNFGTIQGTTTALEFESSGSLLIIEAGSTFLGAVLGGGGTLRLASGVGTISDLTGVDVTVAGSMAATTFENFAAVEIGADASFNDKGPVTIVAGRTLNSAGTLSLGGVVKNSVVNAGLIETTGAGDLIVTGAVQNTGTIAADGGALSIERAVIGTGVAAIDGGVLDLASNFNENVTFGGKGGVLGLARSRAYGGTIAGFSRAGATSIDLRDIGFVSATEATFSGTRSGGVLTVADATHTANINFVGDYLTTSFVASSDGDGGAIVKASAGDATAIPTHRFIAAMASHCAVTAGDRHVAVAVSHSPITMLGAPPLEAP